MHSRRVLLLGGVMLAMTGGLAACGDGPSSDEIARQIDANPSAGSADVFSVQQAKTQQDQADDDAKAAEAAKKRRAELAKLDELQRQETDRILKGGGATGGTLGDSSIPIDGADAGVETFRARLSGVCDGMQQRVVKVIDRADEAAETKDPRKILEAAQDYADTLNDFETSLNGIKPPPSLEPEYADWRDTIDSLSSTIRLLLVSQGDRSEADRLQRKSNKLAARLLDRSARLGVSCISILG